MSTNTQIFDDRVSAFTYAGSWFRDGTWTASNGQSGTLSSTNDQTASVTFTFPVAATAFRYYGMKRSNGGLYGICVDCDPNNPSFTKIDAFDSTDNGKNPPSVLFSQTFSSPSVHVVIIHNEPDSRGQPTGNSQLTLDRFELDVPAPPANTVTIVKTTDAATTVVQPHPQPTTGAVPPSTQLATTVAPTQVTTANTNQVSSSTLTSSNVSSLAVSSAAGSLQSQSRTDSATPVLSPTIAASGGNVTASPSASMPLTTGAPHTTPIGAIIGGALGALAAIATLIILIFWLRVKKKRTGASTTAEPLHVPEPATTRTPTSTATGGWITGYGAGTFEKGGRPYHQPSFSSHPSDTNSADSPSSSASPQSTSSNPASSSQSPQRELDAGPIPRYLLRDDNDDIETLPPDYRQVFSDRRSTRTSQFQRRTPRSPPPPLPTSMGIESPPLTGAFALSTPAFQPVRRS